MQQVDDIGNVIGHRIVDDDIAVVVTHRIAGGWWRQISIDIRRKRRDVGDIGVWEESANDEAYPIGAINCGKAV